MPLKNGAINEILQFAAEALEDAGDVLPLEAYKNHPMRLRGHMAGLALRELQNREARQATHVAAGLAQFIANRYAPGVRDDGDPDKIEQGLLEVLTALINAAIPPAPKLEKYDLCEFYYFRHPSLKPGFQPAQGGLLANAATLYPEAWACLQTVEGQKLCKSEAEWQAMTRAVWATLADGSTVGWNGIGGAPYYAPNTATGALRLPDLRGMYAEAAGFDALGVGGAHGDAVRNITGRITPHNNSAYLGQGMGYIEGEAIRTVPANSTTTQPTGGNWGLDASRVVPVAAKNQPRAWGALPCVYLGQAAS